MEVVEVKKHTLWIRISYRRRRRMSSTRTHWWRRRWRQDDRERRGHESGKRDFPLEFQMKGKRTEGRTWGAGPVGVIDP